MAMTGLKPICQPRPGGASRASSPRHGLTGDVGSDHGLLEDTRPIPYGQHEPIQGLTIEDADVQNLGGLVAP